MAAIKGVITVKGRQKLCEAHAGVRDLPKISEMAWGDGGVDEHGTPKTPTGNETALYHELLKRKVNDPVFVNEQHTTCKYVTELEGDDLVGKEISEVALFDEEGDMVVYQTMLRKGKDEGIPQEYRGDEVF